MQSPTFVATMTARADSRAIQHAQRVAAVAFVTALTAAAAQVSIPLPFTPVPFTFQPMIVLLGGAALGSSLGCYSQLLYLAAGVAGLPVFANSPLLPAGAARLLGPTGGYLMAYPIAAWVVGVLAERGFDRRYLRSVVAMTAGLALIYACGVAWLAFGARLPQALGVQAAIVAGAGPFFLADLVKILAAGSARPAFWRLTGLGRHPR